MRSHLFYPNAISRGNRELFSQIMDISIVIAAYNEEKRLPQTIERMISYLDGLGIRYEFVIVDDGSRDQTRALVEALARRRPEVRLLSHFPNHGRGISIREGAAAAKGEIILETDADGSVADEAVGRFLEYLKGHPGVDCVFGSRELPNSRLVLKQPFLRVVLGYGFLYLARIVFFLWGVSDFTLGFKMFRKKAAQDIFTHQFDNHYLAEAEIVYVAHKRGWQVRELPITWTDNRDSRVRPFRDSIRSLKGIVRVLSRNWKGKYGG